MTPSRQVIGLAALLALATAAAYLPVLRAEFVNFDDDLYVFRNPRLIENPSWSSVHWALTTGENANWFPVTRLSWLADRALWGLNPSGFHATNLLLHVANTLLLFFGLHGATGALGRSAFVAAVFGLHPLHVESVAWISARKDLLSALFWLLASGAYLRHARRPSLRHHATVAALLGLSLMSKPMAVTLPLTLLLIDFWPLNRFAANPAEPTRKTLTRLLVEKLPLSALCMASAAVTIFTQRAAGAIEAGTAFSFQVRALNAALSYAHYVGAAAWPSGLAAYYPHPAEGVSAGNAVLCGIAIATVTLLALRQIRRLPSLAVGWLFFLITLLPVIGLVQVGQQARADRYTYVPLVGLALATAWGVTTLSSRARWPRAIAMGLGLLTTAGMTAATNAQARVWRDSISLFEHALRVTRDNAVAHLNLGTALLEAGRAGEALPHLERVVDLHAGSAEGHGAMAGALARLGRDAEAEPHFLTALRLDPTLSRVHNGFASSLAARGEMGSAVTHFREAIALDPSYDEAAINLAELLLTLQQPEEAIEYLRKGLLLEPRNARAHAKWGQALTELRRFSDAAAQFSEALRLEPASSAAHKGLGLALAHQGEFAQAAAHLRQALTLDPKDPEVAHALGMALARTGDSNGALARFREALALDRDFAPAHNSLGVALGQLGRVDEALAHFEAAARSTPRDVEVRHNWALALAAQRRFEDAANQAREAIRLDPGYADAHNNLGVFLARLGRLQEAAGQFRETLRIDPSRADARDNLASTEAALRRGR